MFVTKNTVESGYIEYSRETELRNENPFDIVGNRYIPCQVDCKQKTMTKSRNGGV